MPAVSLVFALVVGLWAAYLLPQWVRRRDTLGQSRTHDRHSERLRVLPRRRPSRAVTGPSSRPLLTGTQVAVRPGPPVRAGSRALGRPAPVVAPALATPADDVRPAATSAARVAARRRAVVLLALVAATSASWGLVAVAGAPPLVAAPASVLLALDVVALRSAARRRASRAMARRRAERLETIGRERAAGAVTVPTVTGAPVTAPTARSRSARPAGSSARAAASASGRPAAPRPARPAAPVVAPAAAHRPEWDDRRWEDETGEIVGIERVNPLAVEGWAPVPVPVPTYMTKPVVERPKPKPWTPERDFADDLDLDAVLARRRAVNG